MSSPDRSLRATLRSRRGLALVVAVAALALTESVARHASRTPSSAPAPGERPIPVVAEPARSGDISVHLDGLGTVTPRASVTVHTRVDGQLMAVHFQEGQTVASGDLLAEIDPRPFAVQLAQAQGQLARDEALLANARLDLARYRTLARDDVVSIQQRDTQEALVRQYEAAVAVDRAQVDGADLELVYCRITAPVGGRIGLRLVDPGNMVHASDAGGLAVITQLHPIDVVFTLPEDDLPPLMAKVRAGARLAVDAYDRERTRRLATGTLLTVDNAIDPTTGSVRLKAEFANDDDALFPNQFVNARLELDRRHGATLIPEGAVQRGTRGTFVYVVRDDHTVEARPVAVGVTDGPDAAVDAGLAPGDLVVVEGNEGLRPGSPVAVQAPGAPVTDRHAPS